MDDPDKQIVRTIVQARQAERGSVARNVLIASMSPRHRGLRADLAGFLPLTGAARGGTRTPALALICRCIL